MAKINTVAKINTAPKINTVRHQLALACAGIGLLAMTAAHPAFAQEVAASAGVLTDYVADEEILQRLDAVAKENGRT